MNKWIKRFEEILSIPRPSGREEKMQDIYVILHAKTGLNSSKMNSTM